MTDYNKMGDGEINWQVAFHIGLCTVELAEKGAFAPCKNPEDAWPIIVINRIGIIPNQSNGWYALTVDEDFVSDESNPLRAAMIAFLMMKDAENVS